MWFYFTSLFLFKKSFPLFLLENSGFLKTTHVQKIIKKIRNQLTQKTFLRQFKQRKKITIYGIEVRL